MKFTICGSARFEIPSVPRCRVQGCISPVRSKGLCANHYYRQWRNGDPTVYKRRQESIITVIPEENIATVDLTQGFEAIIDIEDAIRVKGYIWRYTNGYARSHQLNLYLHQLILGDAPFLMEIDHCNRNRLDCRKENLRFVTRSQNCKNTEGSDNSQGVEEYKKLNGVSSWYAYVVRYGKKIHLGTFFSFEEASAAHQNAKESVE